MDNRLERINKLKKDIEYYSNEYYNNNNSVISDYEFDKLVEELKALEDQLGLPHSLDNTIGAEVSNTLFSKVNHTVPMMSLSNSYNIDDINRWRNNIINTAKNKNLNIVIEPKVDGLSISCIYKNGKLIQASTRGNGTIGEDVTDNAKKIRNIPLQLKEPIDIEVRGEVYMRKIDFINTNKELEAKGEKTYANPRNLASGTLRHLNSEIMVKRNLYVIFYFIVNSESNSHYEDLARIQQLGLPSIFPYAGLIGIEQNLDKYLDNKNSELFNFEIDGLVLKLDEKEYYDDIGSTHKAPKWAIAYKFPTDKVMTKLTDIEWSVGRTGILTPVAIFNPVQIGGTIVSRASLHNIDEIKRKDIRLGDTIMIEKAAEIIPQVVKPISNMRDGSETIIDKPKECPFCSSDTIYQSPLVLCECGKYCNGAIEEQIVYFANRDVMDIKGLGPAVAEIMVRDLEIDSLDKIYSIIECPTFLAHHIGELNTNKLIKELELSKNKPFENVLSGLQIPNVGKRMSKILANHYNNIDNLIEAIYDNRLIVEIEGIGDILNNSIKEWFNDNTNLELIEKLKVIGLQFSINKRELTNKLNGKIFAISGTIEGYTREQIQDLIEMNGGKATSSISGKTDYLIIGDKPSKGKLDKALKNSVIIIDFDKFKEIIKP